LKTSRRPASSAGILMYRQAGSELWRSCWYNPGGPCRRHKDDGAWSIPKGEMNDGEHAEIAARREFLEEIGSDQTGPLNRLATSVCVNGVCDPLAVKAKPGGQKRRPGSGPHHSTFLACDGPTPAHCRVASRVHANPYAKEGTGNENRWERSAR